MANEITIQDMTNMSVAFAKSGFFGYKNSSEAFTLMCLAQANGLHPAKAAGITGEKLMDMFPQYICAKAKERTLNIK